MEDAADVAGRTDRWLRRTTKRRNKKKKERRTVVSAAWARLPRANRPTDRLC